MFINILDRVVNALHLFEVKAESDPEPIYKPKPFQMWPRLLSFNSSSQDSDCEDEEENTEAPSSSAEEQDLNEVCDDEEDEESKNPPKPAPQCGGFSKKLGCMYNGARFGLREGTLAGLFFGGGFGMYKYFDATYNKDKGDEGGGSDENESTVNDNIIFVSAMNGAIAMAVFCTFFCSGKAMIYCS